VRSDRQPVRNIMEIFPGYFDPKPRQPYEAMLPYTRAQFYSTFEVIEFGHPFKCTRWEVKKRKNP
jgi:hypothetical protein